MGHYAYCENCDHPIEQDDYAIYDIENQYYHCPHCKHQNPCHMTLSDIIDDLRERVAKLETRQDPEKYNE